MAGKGLLDYTVESIIRVWVHRVNLHNDLPSVDGVPGKSYASVFSYPGYEKPKTYDQEKHNLHKCIILSQTKNIEKTRPDYLR